MENRRQETQCAPFQVHRQAGSGAEENQKTKAAMKRKVIIGLVVVVAGLVAYEFARQLALAGFDEPAPERTVWLVIQPDVSAAGLLDPVGKGIHPRVHAHGACLAPYGVNTDQPITQSVNR